MQHETRIDYIRAVSLQEVVGFRADAMGDLT